MADQTTPDIKALAKQPKAFKLPPAPELSATNAQLVAYPECPSSAKRAQFKTSANQRTRTTWQVRSAKKSIPAARQAWRTI